MNAVRSVPNSVFCVECEKTREITVHGKCAACGSDAVVRREGWREPESRGGIQQA
jgi:hypothetical protein